MASDGSGFYNPYPDLLFPRDLFVLSHMLDYADPTEASHTLREQATMKNPA